MANLKSSKKDIRRIKRRYARNVPQRTRLRNLAKKTRGLVVQGELEQAQTSLRLYYRYLDRGARKHLIPKGRAERYKSRVTKLLYAESIKKTSAPDIVQAK